MTLKEMECSNCGAPLTSFKCEYCNSIICELPKKMMIVSVPNDMPPESIHELKTALEGNPDYIICNENIKFTIIGDLK